MNARSYHRLITGLVLVGLAVPHAAPVKAQRQHATLAGINIIQSGDTAYTVVRVPQPARLDIRHAATRPNGPNSNIRIGGSAGFVGFALTEEVPGPPLVIAGRYLICPTNGCETAERVSSLSPTEGDVRFDGGGRFPRYLTIDPGVYRLYLITDGGVGKVRLELLGLSGETRISPSLPPASFDVRTPPGGVRNGATGSLYSAGGSFQGGQTGFFSSLLMLASNNFGNLDWGICNYPGPTAPPSQVAYGRHCSAVPIGAGFSGTIPSGTSNEKRFWARFTYTYGRNGLVPSVDGTQGVGGWAEASGTLKWGYFHTFFLGYSD